MPKPRQSDNPSALTEAVTTMVTVREMEQIRQLAATLGLSKSGAVRFLIREGLATPKVQTLNPPEDQQ